MKQSKPGPRVYFVENELNIIRCLIDHEEGLSTSEIAEEAGISRQLADHHLKRGLKGIVRQETERKIWVLQSAFYSLDTMADYLKPFILKALEIYTGVEADFEKYMSLLLALMVVDL